MNGIVKEVIEKRERSTFLQVLAGEPSEAEIEERYLTLARCLLGANEDGNKAA